MASTSVPDSIFENNISFSTFSRWVPPVVEALFPTGTPRVDFYPRLVLLPIKDRWRERVFLNSIATIGYENPKLVAHIEQHGIHTSKCYSAFKQNYKGFLLFCAYPTPTIDFNNFGLVAISLVAKTILIEQVTAKKNGVNGGRRLIEILIKDLTHWAKAHDIHFIRTVTTSERSLSLFLKNGFREVTASHLISNPNQRHLILVL